MVEDPVPDARKASRALCPNPMLLSTPTAAIASHNNAATPEDKNKLGVNMDAHARLLLPESNTSGKTLLENGSEAAAEPHLHAHSLQVALGEFHGHAPKEETVEDVETDAEDHLKSATDADFCNLIVNYLPNDCAEEELRSLFAPHGEIESTKVVRDRATGVSCGYGFVKYLTHEAASAAIREKQGFALRGKRLKVSVALGPGRGMSAGEFPQNNLIVNYLTHDITEDKLLRLFSAHGEVESVKIVRDRETGMSLCYGFVKFKKDECAALALDALNGLDIGQKRLKVSIARPASGVWNLRNNKLYVSYIPKTYTKEDVCHLFNRFGRILECRVLYDEKGESRCTAFVHMATKAAAEAALIMHGVQLRGTNRGMVVKMAHNKNARGIDMQQSPVFYQQSRIMPMGRGIQDITAQMGGLRLGRDGVMPPYIMHPHSNGHAAGSPPAGMPFPRPGMKPFDAQSSDPQHMNFFGAHADLNMGVAPHGVMPGGPPFSDTNRLRARMPVAGMPYPSGSLGFAPQPPVGSPHGHHAVHPTSQYPQMPMRPPVHPSVPGTYPAMAPYPAPMRATGFYEGQEGQTEGV